MLVAACIYGLRKNQDAATINNVSFAAFHISVLMTGCWPALAKPQGTGGGLAGAGGGDGLSRPVRGLVVVMLALGLGGLSLSAFGCGGSKSSGSDSGSSSLDSTTDAVSKHFLDTYVKSNGRVARTDQGGDTVGEGQAYGMLLAAAIGDENRFDLIWDWTKNNLRGADGLIAFLWRTARSSTPSRRPTPTWTRRARCSRRRAASTAPGCARRR